MLFSCIQTHLWTSVLDYSQLAIYWVIKLFKYIIPCIFKPCNFFQDIKQITLHNIYICRQSMSLSSSTSAIHHPVLVESIPLVSVLRNSHPILPIFRIPSKHLFCPFFYIRNPPIVISTSSLFTLPFLNFSLTHSASYLLSLFRTRGVPFLFKYILSMY